MTVAKTSKEQPKTESRPFEADVAKLLHLMVHSVYSDKSVFLRELIANAADACERLRYESIADPALRGDDVKPRITVSSMPRKRLLTVEDNGIGMRRDEMVEALGTIARSGTKAFLERIEAAQADKAADGTTLIGRFGVGFYSAFMVAERVDVISRRAGIGRGLALVVRTARGHSRSPPSRPPMRRSAAPASCCISWRMRNLYRTLYHRTAGEIAVRPCSGADRDRREAGRRTCRRLPTALRSGQNRSPRSRLPSTPTSIAASPGSSTSRR